MLSLRVQLVSPLSIQLELQVRLCPLKLKLRVIIICSPKAVPALTCNASANGVVMVTWSYIHTGGLPLTNVSMSYTFEDEFIISRPVPVSISSVDTTRITVPNLEEGYRYTFNVTSQNIVGATSALCGVVIPTSGKVYIRKVMVIQSCDHKSLPSESPPSLCFLSLSFLQISQLLKIILLL